MMDHYVRFEGVFVLSGPAGGPLSTFQWGKCGANLEKSMGAGLGTRGVPVPGRRHGKAHLM